MRKRSEIGRLGRLGLLVVVALVLSLTASTISHAATFIFPVQSEQAITGTTTGLGGAQTDDGVRETLQESDTAPDSVTAPATQALTTGTVVGGTFPGDVASEDGVFVQYREVAAGINAIAFDSSTSYAQDASALSFSWSHTTSGSSRFLVVGVSIRNDLSQSVSAVTYAGSPLTFLRADTNGVSVRSELWYRVAPATGANTVLVTLSASAKAAMGAISLTGVDQSVPIDANAGATGSGTAPSVSVTTVANNAWVIDATAFRSTANGEPTGTSGSGQTQQWSGYTESGGVSVNVRGKGSTEGPKNPSGGVVMDWSLSASADWAISAASFRPGVEAEIAYRSNTGANTVSSPKTRTGGGSTWSAEAEQATAGSPIRGVRIAQSPTTPTTRIIVTQSDDGWLDAYVCSPTCAVTNNIGQVWSAAPGAPQKRFDVAYEYASGDALLVYGVFSADVTRDIAYRVYVGGAWSAEQYLDDTGHGTNIQYSSINLASRRGTDQIGLIGGDITNDHVNAWIWDGGAFGSFAEISATAEVPDQEKIAIAWESSSGHLLAVTVPSGSVNIVFREFTTTWGAASTFRCANDNSEYLSLKPNPLATANDMVLALNDDIGVDLNLHTCYWTGSAWSNWNTHDAGIDSTTTRPFDFAWEDSGSRGILVWGTTAGQITYRTFTAPSTWGTITNVAMGTNTHSWVQLRTNPSPPTGAAKVLGAVMEETALDLGAIRWDGTTFTVVGSSTFTADVGTTAYESFELEYRAVEDPQLLVRYDWSGVPAGDSYLLSVKGYRGGEDFNVQVLTPPSTWTTRITVNSLTNQLFTAGMTLSEYNGGSPQVRFVDALRQDGSVSDLFLDLVGVTTIRLTYALEVRHNITGIIAGSNPILVVKGNITAGGENFHIHAWNFVSASWDLLMAAPFTGTNAYHNASLATDHLSGGTVRIRFVDAGSLDLTRWALSLDFVAVVITNDQPALADSGVSPASGYITTSFTFFARYSDPENNAPAFVNLTLDGISYAMVENNSADTNYVDGKDYFLNRAIGVRGTFNFSFSARASAGDLAVATTPVRQVSVVNRSPSISNPIPSDAVHTGRSYVRDFNGTDPDNDTLVWSLSTNAPWLAVGSANGTVWGVAPATVGVFYIEVGAVDGFGGSTSNNYTLSVGNLAPSISNPLTADGIHTGRSYVRGFTGVDPDGDSLLWSVSTNAPWVAIGSANGTVWGVAPSTVGVFYVNIAISDGFGGSASNNYTLSVGNLVPSISNPIGSAVSLRQASFAVDFNALDPDGDALTWSLQTNAGFLSVNIADGTVTGLTWNTPATYWVEVTVSDGFGGTDRLNFSLIVVNRPPQAIVTASETGRENELYEASFSATDPDSDPVGWSLATNATWLTLDPGNAKLTGVALPGVYYVNLTASDPFGGVAFRNFTVRIAAAPIIPNEPDGLGGELFLLIVIVAALGVLIGAVLLPRRRQLVDQAFLIDQDGEIRFHYSTPGAPFDEARLWSHLQGQPWREMTSVAAHPYTLHVVRREGLHWVIVSRSSDASRVIKAAEKLFMAAQMDLEAIGAQIPAPEVHSGET